MVKQARAGSSIGDKFSFVTLVIPIFEGYTGHHTSHQQYGPSADG
jgi:hypothetical protein